MSKCIVCSNETNNKVKFKKTETYICIDCSLIIMRSMIKISRDVISDNKPKPKPKQAKLPILPTPEEITKFGESIGHKIDGKFIYDYYYNDGVFLDSRGNKVLNWKQKIRSVWCKEENKIPETLNIDIDYIYACIYKGESIVRLMTDDVLEYNEKHQIEIQTKKKIYNKGLIKAYIDGCDELSIYDYNNLVKPEL